MPQLARTDFRFLHRLRVRWAEVDMQKIVFNAHYLMYFDTAITDYWRALAMPYEASMHQLDGDLYVVKATVEFHRSARMDDQIDVGLRCARVGNTSLTFTGAIFRGDEHLISGELVYVFADPATQTSRPVPQAFRDLLTGFEAGESVLAVRTGDWAELGRDAQHIRHEVFVQEQGIPKDLEHDAADAQARHAVAYNRLGQAVATGRLLPARHAEAQIGRLAVHRSLRGGGVGRQLLAALQDAARQQGVQTLMLHAQESAIGFYLRLGWQPRGEPFVEAGIRHVEMVLPL